MKTIILYPHPSKESARQAAEAVGLTGQPLELASYLGSEHKCEFEVDHQGHGKLVAVDDRPLGKARKQIMFDASAFHRQFRYLALREWWRVWGVNVILAVWFLLAVVYALLTYTAPPPASGF